jgi:acyl-coenzyme A thioesterase PaaI-like protein
VLHFLAPNRVGPVRATALPVGRGRRADGAVLRVEMRDEGADRVTALAVATVGA